MRQHSKAMSTMAVLVLSILLAASIPQAKATDSITYDAPSDTITVLGYSEATPCTFTDVYNADVAGGWGQVSKQGTNQFLIDAKLTIGGDGTDTYFASECEQVVFSVNAAQVLWVFGYYDGQEAHLRLGTLDSQGRATNGSCLIFLHHYYSKVFRTYNAEILIYDSKIVMLGAGYQPTPLYFENGYGSYDTLRIYQSRIEYTVPQYMAVAAIDSMIDGLELYNITLTVNVTPDYEWVDIKIMGYPYYNIGLLAQFAQPLTIKNLIFTQDYGMTYIGLYGDCHLELIDPVWNNSLVGIMELSDDEWVKIQWTFNLFTTYPNGTFMENANVTISNAFEGQVGSWLTDSDGKIPTQILTQRLYNESCGGTAFNWSYYDYNPYQINATSQDLAYIYYKSWTMENTANWEIALLPLTTSETNLYLPVGFILGALIILPIGILISKKH